MRTIKKLFPIIALFVLMGCASNNVRSTKYTEDDFSNFKTFAYLPNTSFSVNQANNMSDKSVEESLIEAMNSEMTNKGYSLDTSNPDLLVLLITSNALTSASNTNRNANSYEQAPEGSSSSGGSPNYASVSSSDYKRYFSSSNDELSNRAYKNGSLVVQVFNKTTKELVWVGIAENFQAHISDQTLMTRMISEIFKEFPI